MCGVEEQKILLWPCKRFVQEPCIPGKAASLGENCIRPCVASGSTESGFVIRPEYDGKSSMPHP